MSWWWQIGPCYMRTVRANYVAQAGSSREQQQQHIHTLYLRVVDVTQEISGPVVHESCVIVPERYPVKRPVVAQGRLVATSITQTNRPRRSASCL